MATANPFDLLGDDDNEDPWQLIAVQQQMAAPKKAIAPTQAAAQQAQQQPKSPKMPSKPLPPSVAVREAKTEAARGGGRGSGRGYGHGRGGGGFNREPRNSENFFNNSGFSGGGGFNREPRSNEHSFNSGFSGVQGAPEDSDSVKPSERLGGYGGPRGPFRGSRPGGFSNGEVGDEERPRRVFERRSGTGRGNEVKREGTGTGNWGNQTDEHTKMTEEAVNEGEKNVVTEKPSGEDDAADDKKENHANESEEKEPEDKEMTLEEYEKVLEKKRKSLLSLKTEERKVDVDKELASMQQLSSKKSNDDVFIKLGFDKDKRKEAAEKEEKAKKSVSINEFLKPAEGERYYSPGSRGRGRGRGSRGGFSGGGPMSYEKAPSIEDPGQFPTLGAK